MFVPADTTPPTDPTPDAPATPDTDTPPATEPKGPESALAAIDLALADPAPADDADVPPGDTPPAEPQAAVPDPNAPPATPEPSAPPPPTDLDLSEREIDTLFKGRGKERVKAMHSELRELRPLREQVAQIEPLKERAAQADQFEQVVRESFTDPQAFQQTVAVAKAMNSGDPVRMRQAYDFMNAQTRHLAEKLGIEGPGFDPIAADPRLRAAVEAGQITPELAREFAATRGQTQLQTQRTQVQEQQFRAQQEHDGMVRELNDFSTRMQQADPHYAYRAAVIEAAAPSMAALAPAAKARAVMSMYQSIPAPAAAPIMALPPPPVRQAPPLAGSMPVRPTGASSASMVGKPKSPLEAINNALGAFGT